MMRMASEFYGVPGNEWRWVLSLNKEGQGGSLWFVVSRNI